MEREKCKGEDRIEDNVGRGHEGEGIEEEEKNEPGGKSLEGRGASRGCTAPSTSRRNAPDMDNCINLL